MMKQEDKQLLLKELCARLPYGVKFTLSSNNIYTIKGIDLIVTDEGVWEYAVTAIGIEPIEIEYIKPYLRPMSSMTKKEKKELLCTVVGKNAVKYFQVLSDGSIGSTDAEYQDLQNFTMHWINFDTLNTTSYIDWLNAHHFDYCNLIERGLALPAPEGMYKF